MKIKFLFRTLVYKAFYLMVFLGTALYSNAQCPTIPNQQPAAICDASGFTFNDLNAYAVDGGNGILWYNMASGGSSFSSNELVTEGVYYVDDNFGTCGNRTSITIDFAVDSVVQKLDGIYCDNINAVLQNYIDDILIPNIPAGGSVAVYEDVFLTTLVASSEPITQFGANYYVVFIDSSGCRSQIQLGNSALFKTPSSPTPESTQAFCSSLNPTVGDLDPGTEEIFKWYSNLDGDSKGVPPSLNMSTPLINGATYYVQANNFLCSSGATPVVVSISQPNQPGTDTPLNYCSTNLPSGDFNLFDVLDGSKDTTGSWSGPLPTSNNHLGAVNISSLTPGDYSFTYTVPDNGGCLSSSSEVNITIEEGFVSGTATSPIIFCKADLPTSFDLTTLLNGEDTGGQWTQNGTAVMSPIDLSAFAVGTFNFTYTQNIGATTCTENAATVEINVIADPNPGTAVNAEFCENNVASNSPYDLFNTLDGTQNNNSGVWTDANGTTVTNPIDISSFVIANSPYQFTYTIGNGTCNDSITTLITLNPAPKSGTPVASMPEFCEGAVAPKAFDLFDLLENEDQTGTWFLGTDNTGATTTNTVDLSILAPGTYNYTYDVDAIALCDDALVTVQVTINGLPNTGTATPFVLCENDPAVNTPLDLFSQLAGNDAGGTWLDDDSTGALTTNTVDLSQLAVGIYNYTYTILDANSCTNDSTVKIEITVAPKSGTPVASMPEFCEGAVAPKAFDLFDLLENEDQTGTWFLGTDNTGATTTNTVDLSILAPGTYNYTYDVDAIALCDDALVTVQVTINGLPNTGTATPLVLCENDPAVNTPLDLFSQLAGNDAGGTWLDDDSTGALTTNTVDLSQLAVGVYNYSYAITDANSCNNGSTVKIEITAAPEAGTVNGTPEFCLSEITAGQTVNLFDSLDGEDQTGVWIDNTPSSQLAGSTVTIDGLAAGTYTFTYDVDAVGTCDDADMPTVSIVINETTAPTTTAPTQVFCDTATLADLSVSGSSIQWYDTATGGTLLPETTALVNGQVYYASQTDTVNSCESLTRVAITAEITGLPSAGAVGATSLSVCNDGVVALNSGLDGTEDTGGIWYEGTDNTGTVVNMQHDFTGYTVGNYQFTYVVSPAPCPTASTTITVAVQEPLDAGTDGAIDICNFDDGTTYDLFAEIGGTPDSGGTWIPALASTTSDFDPSIDNEGTYTYFLTNACGNFSSKVIVTVTDAPNAGTDDTFTICAVDINTSNNTLDLLTVLADNPDTTGTFANDDSAGGFAGTNLDLSLTSPGTYRFTYTVLATGKCTVDDTAVATVVIEDTAAATVIEATPEFCLENNPTVADLEPSVTGTNLMWYVDATDTTPLDSTEALIDGEDYFVTQTSANGCESVDRVFVTISIGDAPTPTLINNDLELCINDTPLVNELTLNITEYDATANNVVWYDAMTNGSALANTDEIQGNTTYYAALINQTTGCESSERLEVIPDLTSCGVLDIPDGFSPNGDGVNDTFDMDNINIIYPNYEIEIFNRYGNIVYKGTASTPAFTGQANESRLMGSGDLPVGVYYYIFNFNNGKDKPKQGNLYLSR